MLLDLQFLEHVQTLHSLINSMVITLKSIHIQTQDHPLLLKVKCLDKFSDHFHVK